MPVLDEKSKISGRAMDDDEIGTSLSGKSVTIVRRIVPVSSPCEVKGTVDT